MWDHTADSSTAPLKHANNSTTPRGITQAIPNMEKTKSHNSWAMGQWRRWSIVSSALLHMQHQSNITNPCFQACICSGANLCLIYIISPLLDSLKLLGLLVFDNTHTCIHTFVYVWMFACTAFKYEINFIFSCQIYAHSRNMYAHSQYMYAHSQNIYPHSQNMVASIEL